MRSIQEIRDAVQALTEEHLLSNTQTDVDDWERHVYLMELLLHIHDGLDIIDTRILAIQNILTRLYIVRQDAKGEGETPVP